MVIRNEASAGAAESADVLVTGVRPAETLELRIASTVRLQFGAAIEQTVHSVLRAADVQQGEIAVDDHGALDWILACPAGSRARTGGRRDRMRRSMLFVPGNNPKMMTSCGFFGADAIIFDLEDAVSPDEKDAARILVKYAVTNVERCRSEIIVRVNAADTPLFAQDLEAIVPQRPDYIMLPKTASRQTVCGCDAAIGEIERRCGMEPGHNWPHRADRDGARRGKRIRDRDGLPACAGTVSRRGGSERRPALQPDKGGTGDSLCPDAACYSSARRWSRRLRHPLHRRERR